MVDPRLYSKPAFWEVSTVVGRSIMDSFAAHLRIVALKAEKADGTKQRALGGRETAAASFSSLSFSKRGGTAAIPLKVHKSVREVELELQEQEKGQLVLTIVSMCLGVVSGAREAGHTNGLPTAEEFGWEKELLGSKEDRREGQGQGAREDDDVDLAYSSESSLSDGEDTAAAAPSEGPKIHSGSGAAALTTAASLDVPPPSTSKSRRRSSTALAAASVRASVETILRANNGADGARGFGRISGKASKDLVDGCESLLRVICPLSPCLSKAAERGDGAGSSGQVVERETAVDVSDASERRTTKDMYRFFSAAIAHNPFIKNVVNARRFSFAEVLEEAELSTDPEQWAKGPAEYHRLFPAAVPVTWTGIVGRMVRYLKAHNFDKDEEHCIRVFNALTAHLLRARAKRDGTLLSITQELEGDEMVEKLAAFRKKQAHLNTHGAVQAALLAVATHDADVFGNVADVASTFLTEVVRYGNGVTQETVFEYISEMDKDAKVLTYLRSRLNAGRSAILERQASGGGVGFQLMEEEKRHEYAHLGRALSLVTLLMDGHNEKLQNLLRHQPKRDFSIDLITQAVELFVLQTANNHTLARMETAEVELLTETVQVLVEAMQGPCYENQKAITANPVFFTSVDRVMHSRFDARVSASARLGANAAAVELLAACLEGRTDTAVHNIIAVELLPLGLDEVRHQLCSLHSAAVQGALPKEECEEAIEVALLGLVSLTSVYDKMRAVPSFYKQLTHLTAKRHKLHGLDAMDSEVGQVEVNWNGTIEVVSFRNPPERVYLSTATKQKFEDSVDLRTAGKRTAALLANTHAFIFEMRQISFLCNTRPIYRQLYPFAGLLRWVVYALACVLNLNLLMSTVGSGKGDRFREERKVGKNNLSNSITYVVGLAVLVGYCVLVCFFSVSEIPLLIHKTDANAKLLLSNPLVKKSAYRDGGQAFTQFGLVVVGVFLFIFMHWFNYTPSTYDDSALKNQQNFALYETLVFAFLAPYFLRCCRAWIVVPDTKATRVFAITYDLLFKKSFFLRYTLLIIFTVAGFSRPEYSTLLLLEILNLEFLLGAVVKCVIVPARSLLLVMYLIVCSSMVYAMFGLRNFEKENWGNCHSALSCFWQIVYKHVISNQAIGAGEMSHREADGGPIYMLRMLYDLLWFIWIFLLFKLLTGLLFSTFTKLNSAMKQRKDVLGNTGFVSGLGRGQYGDLGIISPTFDELVTGKQDHWQYVNFLLHLTNKNSADFNGCESFVQKNLDEASLEWLPVKTSFAIQALAKAGRDTSALKSGEIVTLESTLAAFRKDFDLLTKDVKDLNHGMSKLVDATTGGETGTGGDFDALLEKDE